MAEVTTMLSEVKGQTFLIYHVEDGNYEMTTSNGFGFLSINLEVVDDLIDVLTTFKNEMGK